MIRKINKKDNIGLMLFLQSTRDNDFYYTEDNKRTFVNTSFQLSKFLKSCSISYCFDEGKDITGILSIWKSEGNNVCRYYLKITGKTTDIVKKLLKVLFWNHNLELFAKFNKHNKFLPILMSQGFKFIGDRGKEILIKRDKDKTR